MHEHLRMAVECGQLPEDLDIPLAVNAFHAAIGGVLAHWLFSPEDFELNHEAERLADAMIDMLRFSTALRKGYVPRPMGPIDAEMATFCGSSTPQALAE